MAYLRRPNKGNAAALAGARGAEKNYQKHSTAKNTRQRNRPQPDHLARLTALFGPPRQYRRGGRR